MPASDIYQIDFEPMGKCVEVAPDTNLLDAARRAGIALASVCGGEGSCGRCRVVVIDGKVSPSTSAEEYILAELERHRGERLACCTIVKDNVKVHVPRGSLITGQRLQVAGDTRNVVVKPIIHTYQVAVPVPTLKDLRADLERVVDTMSESHGQRALVAEPAVVCQISESARHHDWRLTVYACGNEIVGVAPYGARPVGLAVDLGTIKIAAYLVDLETGEELAVTGTLNPQMGYGEDVISRLVHAQRSADGARALAEMVRETLNEVLGKLTEQAGVTCTQVADICIVGNTAMTHLLLALPVRQLAVAPYVAACNSAIDVKARSLGLITAPGAYVHVLPGIGGFVGADHVAMILASDLDRTDRVALGVDIGTNTEITLVKPGMDFLVSVSCASGPAFEGAHISDGMRAASGAIEAVRLSESGLELKTIDNAPAVGLCGSGIIDAVAELRRWNLINKRGRFVRGNGRVRAGRRGREFLLVPGTESGSGRDVVITQEDINEVLLAKGAIRSGIEVLLEMTDTAAEEVEEVIIAGAFGSFLSVQSALAIGLFPHLPHARYKQVGNAAGVGAKRALLSLAERNRAQQIASNTTYIELTSYPKFNRRFALAMLFPDDALTAQRG